MKKQFISRFAEWQNYVHYLLLTASVFIIHWLSGITNFELKVINSEPFAWIELFLFYFIGLLIADTLIHLTFWVLPKPFKWQD